MLAAGASLAGHAPPYFPRLPDASPPLTWSFAGTGRVTRQQPDQRGEGELHGDEVGQAAAEGVRDGEAGVLARSELPAVLDGG